MPFTKSNPEFTRRRAVTPDVSSARCAGHESPDGTNPLNVLFMDSKGPFAWRGSSPWTFPGWHNKGMGRIWALLLFAAALLLAANFKLYMKDGTYHIVREYHLEGDRVKFYSVERSEWEEMPAELLDLKRTDAENAARAAKIETENKMIDEEEKVRREQDREVMKIPQDPGAYMIENNQLRIFKQAESKVHSNKGRTVLKVLSPLPTIAGKATLELDNAHSENILKDNRPEIYLQLSAEEEFGIIKLTPKGEVRIADRLSIVPVTKEVVDDIDIIPIFRKQMTDSLLYKIWPEQPLENGEYAVAQFTPGKTNMQIWDFAVKAQKP